MFYHPSAVCILPIATRRRPTPCFTARAATAPAASPMPAQSGIISIPGIGISSLLSLGLADLFNDICREILRHVQNLIQNKIGHAPDL